MKQIHFFATRDDLGLVLDEIERVGRVSYVVRGQSTTEQFVRYSSWTELSNLGAATSESAISSKSYLLTANDTPLRPRRIELNGGGATYSIDQLASADSVLLTPGGTWGPNALLQGDVGTASDTAVSKELMSRFRAAFKSRFSKIQGCWVGPQATQLLQNGVRLTAAVQSPREFDLALDPK